MKLIIDIDEDYVKIINKNGASNYPEEVIKNGTPLDKIRAEIEKISIAPFATAYTAKHEALKIIDRYKAKSEDKE